MPTLILLNPQVYQAPESVIMNQRIHYFHDLGLSYFYRLKVMAWIAADNLQWTIYVKTKNLHTISTKFFRFFNPSLGKLKSIFFTFGFYPLSFTN